MEIVRFSDKFLEVPDPGTGVFGVGDVVGVSGTGPVGVSGTGNAVNAVGVDGTGPVGVQGSSSNRDAGNGVGGGNGVKGIADGDSHGSPPDPVSTTTSGVFGQSQFAVGVIGDSLNGPGGVFRSEFQAGIVGHSTHGHGGIFESFPTDPQEGTSSAQMRIVPAKIPPGQRIAPFPPNPQIGDFFIRTVHTLLELQHSASREPHHER